ncbi:MAG TPA: histidine kinase [Rhodothermales bacterium]|nr:histidine kinase [Rhodothermales bacterium]
MQDPLYQTSSPNPGTGLWGPYASKRRWVEPLLIVAFWTLIAALTIGRRIIDPHGGQDGIRTGQIWQALLEYGVWAVVTPGIFWLSRRFAVERETWLGRIFLHLSIGVIVATIFDVFGHATYAALVVGEERTFSLANSLLTFRFIDELIIYLTVLAAGFARDYFMRFQERQAEMIHLRTQAVKLQAQLAEARLQTLRMQVNPHFLFNTLHAVSSLVERDPRGVRRMIARLSELLRYTMERAGEQEVSLHEELLFLEGYLEIQQIRFQDRLEVEEDIAPDVLDALVPSLILQPLVENAIKHGVSRIEEMGRIEIKAWREDETLCLSVRDNGPGLVETSGDGERTSEGVGLRNTRERLQSLYGTAQQLVLKSAPSGGAHAQIRLPFHTRADLHAVLSD